jgi:hypothetical protein
MAEENNGGAVEGFSLTGEEVQQMSNKTFKICAVPFYREVPNLDKSGEMKRKLIIPVKLSNGTQTEWYANKTSQAIILAEKGRDLDKWVGFTGEWQVKMQVVGKDERPVIYLKSKPLN